MKITQPLFLLSLMSVASLASAADLSEQDYFSELPEVLTVTRLAQPLRDTPGAVTVINREAIRRSGARELTDVLRLVPGYMVGGYNGANPGAAYHTPIDDYGTRNLVLLDGRSVYSSFFLGDTSRGMKGILLEDIERVEVLRGSNSSAYGANAMFGVINIITRHSEDTHGNELSITKGGGGISDNYARIGWGRESANFRITAGRRTDSGYLKAYDEKIVSQLHFRGDLRVSADQELRVSAGMSRQSAGDGFPGYLNNGNPERTVEWESLYLHGVWQRQLSDTDQLKISASYDEETTRDAFPYRISVVAPTVAEVVTIDFGGKGRRLNFELQHQVGLGEQIRSVWGIGYKYEDALSFPLFYTHKRVSIDEKRLFGNLEWRPHARWLINAGGFWGGHSRKGSYFMPRLMANFHVTPEHTLRIGHTKSARMPNLFELASDRRYDTATYGQLRYDAATGNVSEEILKTEELGYFGDFHQLRMTLDVRAYIEKMSGVIDKRCLVTGCNGLNTDYFNYRNLETHGIEYQLRWKPLDGTEIWLNHNDQRLFWSDKWKNHQPPKRAMSLAFFQRLPYGGELGVIHSTTTPMTWHDPERSLKEIRRTDIRLAYPFRLGTTKAEAALTVHAADGDYVASYLNISHPAMIQERRAFGTLRLEF